MSLNFTYNECVGYHLDITLQMHIKCISYVISSQSIIESLAKMSIIKYIFLFFNIQTAFICVFGKVCICDNEEVIFTNQCQVYKMDKCKSCSPLDCAIEKIT